ncbi:MAG: class B sortase [Clostridiales bacterium]|nr:class B sortase [Clostridiales bacterium]
MLIISLIAVICRGGYELRGAAGQYTHEARVKEGMSAYRLTPEADGSRPGLTLAKPEIAPAWLHAGGSFGDCSALGGLGSPTAAESGHGVAPVPVATPAPVVNPHIAALQDEVNEDIAGWLTVAGTRIDYPFVWAGDHETYLDRDVYGSYAKAGTLFMDYRCPADLSGFYTIIYGHHMKNGSMFGDLKLFADEGFFEANPRGEIRTKHHTYSLDIFAWLIVRADDEMVYGAYPERSRYYDYIEANAVNYREPDRDRDVIALSTCAYEFADARMVLLANIYVLPNDWINPNF